MFQSFAGDKLQPGILPLTINEIMEAISQAPHRAFLIRCSYLEIYKETITDLLANKTVEVHEDKKRVGAHLPSRTQPHRPNVLISHSAGRLC